MDFASDLRWHRVGKSKNDTMSDQATRSETVLLPAACERPPEGSLSSERVNSLPGPSWGIVLLAWLVRLSAFINLISSLLPQKPNLVHWLGPWMPFEISEGTKLRMFLTSMLLFILASGLAKGKRTAWLLTMATLAIAPILHLGQVTIWPQVPHQLGFDRFSPPSPSPFYSAFKSAIRSLRFIDLLSVGRRAPGIWYSTTTSDSR